MTDSFITFSKSRKQLLEDSLHSFVSPLECPDELKESMLYSLEAGGKRVRPILLFAVLHAYGKRPEIGIEMACAIEMIHTYSLIHDDLPAMDDDDIRRGKPTNHKVFGEAIAILAGDALLTHSFGLIAGMNHEEVSAEAKIALVTELSKAAGTEGMVAGQVLDMLKEGKSLSLQELQEIHIHKTGVMIMVSLLSGGILAGATEEELQKLKMFGMLLGLAFQIQDDILDYEGDEEKIGKRVGSDETNHKSTYVSIFSIEKAKEYLQDTYNEAIQILNKLPFDTEYLEEICKWVVKRDN